MDVTPSVKKREPRHAAARPAWPVRNRVPAPEDPQDKIVEVCQVPKLLAKLWPRTDRLPDHQHLGVTCIDQHPFGIGCNCQSPHFAGIAVSSQCHQRADASFASESSDSPSHNGLFTSFVLFIVSAHSLSHLATSAAKYVRIPSAPTHLGSRL